MNDMEIKNCNKCNSTKQLDQFHNNKKTKDRKTNWCKDCCKKISLEYHYSNKESILIKQREYRKNNRDYFNAKTKEWSNKTGYISLYQKNRIKNDSFFKFKNRIRNLIRISVLKRGYTKDSKSFEILGCDYDFFIKYIELKFLNGMTWSNHGKWHLDHIIPISLAKTKEEVIKLNHYTNFQPLWAIDNLRKYNKSNETYGKENSN